jgi:hypothetical protein
MNRRRYPVAVHRSAEGAYRASPTPTITGEDIYEIADFEKLCSVHAVDRSIRILRPLAAFCGRTR